MSCRIQALDFVSSEWETVLSASDTLHIRYAPREMICQAGSYLAGIHLILSGVVSDALPGSDIDPISSELLGTGDLIGIEMLGEGDIETSASVCVAITEVELLFFERAAFEKQLGRNSKLLNRVLRYVASRHARTRRDLRRPSSDVVRLCRLVLRLGDLCGIQDDADNVTLPEAITSRTLGELSGLTNRRFRDMWSGIKHVDLAESGIRYQRDALAQSASMLREMDLESQSVSRMIER